MATVTISPEERTLAVSLLRFSEIVPLVLVVLGGIAVWWRSRGEDSGGPGTGDEASVEE